MATVFTVGNGEGDRRCDARCHEATQPECDCVCGGRFHGAAVNGTLSEKVQEKAEEMLAYCKANGVDIKPFQISWKI